MEIMKIVVRSVNKMITKEKLIKAKYLEYQDTYKGEGKYLMQKRIMDKKGTKYFINYYIYNMSAYYSPKYPCELSYDVEVQFDKGKETFNLILLASSKHTIKSVELFFEDVFKKLGCDRYD